MRLLLNVLGTVFFYIRETVVLKQSHTVDVDHLVDYMVEFIITCLSN